jgi:hypothetical protein
MQGSRPRLVLLVLAIAALPVAQAINGAGSSTCERSSGTLLDLLQSSLQSVMLKDQLVRRPIAARNLLLSSELLLQQGLGLRALHAANHAINNNSMNGGAWSARARALVHQGRPLDAQDSLSGPGV